MANSKISALTAATTPLAGTEVLPIVQSGVTKQVSVANLTAGRAVSMSTLAVGVASPATTGEISGAPGTFRISGTGGTVPQLQLSSAGVVNWSLRANQNTASDFTIYQDSTERIKVASGGSTSINVNTVVPSAGSITGTNLWVIGVNATNNTVLLDAFGSNSLLAFRRASGTAASPTAVTSGSSLANIGARGYGATGYSSGNRASINISAAETWTDTAQGTRIAFNTTAIGSATLSERMSVENTGDVNINSGNLVPSTAAKGINFTANTPAAGMTSQLLNWYEEGTFTPAVRFGGGTTGITYSRQNGRYTRVGKLVTVTWDVRLSNKGSSTGAFTLAGLPFSAEGAGGGYSTSQFYFYSGFTTIKKMGTSYTNGGTTLNEVVDSADVAVSDTHFTNTSIFFGSLTYLAA